MAFKVKPVAELEKQFTITEVDGIPEIDTDTPVVVAFRQATEGDNVKRDGFISVPITRSYTDDSDYAHDRFQLKPVGERKSYEVYMTMTECDIEGEDGTAYFKFSEINGARHIAGSFEKFQKRWGELPPALAKAIHNKCIEANPTWGPRPSADNGDGGE